MSRGWIVAVMLLALTGCGSQDGEKGQVADVAEVLPGSASDAMIAYDTLKSQPPVALPEPPAADDAADRPSRERSDEDATETPDDAAVVPSPTTPAAEASSAL